MVTLTNPNNILEEPNRWVGLSTDSKPTTAHNGDEFIEMDTSKQYMYDEESSDWVEITVSGGGGGGTSFLTPLLLVPGDYESGDVIDEQTLNEIVEAVFDYDKVVALHIVDSNYGANLIAFLNSSGTISTDPQFSVTLDYDTGEISVNLI